MEKFVTQGLLYDFYAELLTQKQKRIYAEVVLNDYSISEIARDEGISRQSVSDMIKRCDQLLLAYEKKLGLIKKFTKTKEILESINALAKEFGKNPRAELVMQIEELSERIIEL
ncbi:MAG: DNA-binding protein [Johnsonella sp.]|nr:DNA-binding protein [Johnsonella sp.]